MNYQEMSDAKINLLVGKELGMDVSLLLSFLDADDWPIGGRAEQWVKNNKTDSSFDPCNSWADAGPIILENRISVMFDRSLEEGSNEEWCLASSPCDQIIVDYVSSDKLLRAAMIVFLMMKGGE